MILDICLTLPTFSFPSNIFSSYIFQSTYILLSLHTHSLTSNFLSTLHFSCLSILFFHEIFFIFLFFYKVQQLFYLCIIFISNESSKVISFILMLKIFLFLHVYNGNRCKCMIKQNSYNIPFDEVFQILKFEPRSECFKLIKFFKFNNFVNWLLYWLKHPKRRSNDKIGTKKIFFIQGSAKNNVRQHRNK